MVMMTTKRCFGLRTGGMLLAATMLAGCGLGGDGEAKQEDAREDSGLVRALRAIGAAKDAFDGKSDATPDAAATQGTTAAEEASPMAGLGSVLEAFAGGSATASAQAQDGEPLDRESIAAMAAQMDEELRRMKASGDMSGSGDVMRRMMELGNAMQNMDESNMDGQDMDESNPPEAGTQPAVAAAATPAGQSSDEMRALGGIPVNSAGVSEEQLRALFAPQEPEGTR